MVEAGRWLAEQRERRGLSVRAFAQALGVSTQVIYKWQNGDNAVSDENAAKIADVLGMRVLDVRRDLGLWTPADDEQNKRILYADLEQRDGENDIAYAERLLEKAMELLREQRGA